jgi:hypothetical protein
LRACCKICAFLSNLLLHLSSQEAIGQREVDYLARTTCDRHLVRVFLQGQIGNFTIKQAAPSLEHKRMFLGARLHKASTNLVDEDTATFGANGGNCRVSLTLCHLQFYFISNLRQRSQLKARWECL